jgi:hypothetical protein
MARAQDESGGAQRRAGLTGTHFKLSVGRAALVITDLLSPRGAAWEVVGQSVDNFRYLANAQWTADGAVSLP